jgi:NAD(P)-dependent dehydrogenase (short-subunit alcohol dehydrogenase family)
LRSVLVTGASSGIGAACAVRLRDRGWRVLAGVRRAGTAPEGCEERLIDVTDPPALELTELHGLVNNAGIAVAGPLEFLQADELRRQLEVNVVGQLRMTQLCLPALRAARGRVVNMGSISGRNALPLLGAYAMSKFALEAMTDSLRVELEPWGIPVAIVEPGAPPEAVAEAVEHALTAEKPRTRYLVGRDAKLRARVQLLPDRVRDRVIVKRVLGE